MITEDFVSFETSKLLKEKGFNAKCDKCYAYFADDDIRVLNLKYSKSAQSLSENRYPCITLQMAMKWLREIHNIHIDIDPEWTSKGGFSVIGYCFNIHSIVNPWYEDFVIYSTYEQAVEAANKYCLENLI